MPGAVRRMLNALRAACGAHSLRIVPNIAVSVQAEPADLPSWLDLARRRERGGFRALPAQLLRQAEELGITSYVVREQAVADLEHVLPLTKQAERR